MAGTATRLIADWTTDQGPRHTLYGQVKGLVLRWLNEAQLRFVDKSEILEKVWEPTLSSDGYIQLPDDFLRDGVVKWEADKFLRKGDYGLLNTVSLSATLYYAIYAGKLYVFKAAAGSPTITYLRKPDEIVAGTLANADLELPSEYHAHLLTYMDAMFARRNNDLATWKALMKDFDQEATAAGIEYRQRRQGVRFTEGGVL